METEIEGWVALNMVPGVGRVLSGRLVDRFGSPQAVFSANKEQLCRVEMIGEKTASGILNFDWKRAVGRELDEVRKRGIQVITQQDANYPAPLKTIYDPPLLLYVQGEWREDDWVAVAIVGSRSPTSYGKLMAERLGQGLAERGVTVVSGLARGIDSCAHQGVLSVGGRTIAVLGCGLGIVYPPENRKLMERIGHSGALLSEFSLFTKPERLNFPVRNRLISGLSLGTVVVEAASHSGALITAHFSLEQGREVFAVPGLAYSPKSKGAHRLIKQGAKLVEEVEDILEELSPEAHRKLKAPSAPTDRSTPSEDLSPEEELVLSQVAEEGGHIDTIIQRSQLQPSQVSGLLVMLEIKGWVRQLPGKIFIKMQSEKLRN